MDFVFKKEAQKPTEIEFYKKNIFFGFLTSDIVMNIY